MTTTRHLIERQRRLATRPAPAKTVEPVEPVEVVAPAGPVEPARASGRLRRAPGALAWLALLTVLLGAAAGLCFVRASALQDRPALRNSALTDPAATAGVKGAVTAAVNSLFSYDYTDPSRTDTAAGRLLTGSAVRQYAALLAPVKQQATQRKLVLTTTVTGCGVEQMQGDRARLLVFAEQRDTSTAASGGSTEAPAMFAVTAVRSAGTWRISAIDTFTG
ncbi:hypothetical protein [Streptacidiphilus monticola]|uniref:Mce-associated membrane protein n=1 Tax=Streptacidiphilus monticola TaxID=2161674 RepID=A0ABW1G9Q8_9ACTN